MKRIEKPKREKISMRMRFYGKMIIAYYEFSFAWISVAILFYMKIHNEFFYFLSIALNYTIYHIDFTEIAKIIPVSGLTEGLMA